MKEFTGVYDKNGIQLCENDSITLQIRSGEKVYHGRIIWLETTQSFWFKCDAEKMMTPLLPTHKNKYIKI